MSALIQQIIAIDAPALITTTFSALACALLGNYLLLRRMSLMGDAISHAVLPGIVVAFLITGTRTDWPVFIGASIAGILTVILINLIQRFGRLESGAAMGVVFSIFFAAGVLLIEQAAARHVDLDADCLLHGQLETIFWYPPTTMKDFFQASTLALIPTEVFSSIIVFVLALAFVSLLYKELAITAFDSALANTLGFNSTLLHYLLMIFIACAVVASFKVVGAILVIAMIICPAATARFFTDRLRIQLKLSLFFAFTASILGYLLAVLGPTWFGYTAALNAAGMITVVAGSLLFGSILVAPKYGVIAKFIRKLNLELQVYREDLLGQLYREYEIQLGRYAQVAGYQGTYMTKLWLRKLAERQLLKAGDVQLNADKLQLTEQGLTSAQSLIRRHRLWENFLVQQAGLQADHVHHTAEQLEHFTDSSLSKALASTQSYPEQDPHGKKIP